MFAFIQEDGKIFTNKKKKNMSSSAILGLGAVEVLLYPPFVIILSGVFLAGIQNAVVFIDKRASESISVSDWGRRSCICTGWLTLSRALYVLISF